jgi:hypothetical protein
MQDPNGNVIHHLLKIDRELQEVEKYLETAEESTDDFFLASSSLADDERIYKETIKAVVTAAKKGERLLKRRNRLIDWYEYLSPQT